MKPGETLSTLCSPGFIFVAPKGASMPSHPGLRSLLLASLILATPPYGTILVRGETIRLEPDGTGTRSTLSESIPHNISLPHEGPTTFDSEIRRWAPLDYIEVPVPL
jgi:hypothetical protein